VPRNRAVQRRAPLCTAQNRRGVHALLPTRIVCKISNNLHAHCTKQYLHKICDEIATQQATTTPEHPHFELAGARSGGGGRGPPASASTAGGIAACYCHIHFATIVSIGSFIGLKRIAAIFNHCSKNAEKKLHD